ncbi:putative Ig domain-containing protein [Acidovorax delafieldii]|uniref:Putative Ig domain-containing protein n=1 Tax=Acidovorax delafieldii TaxID=47920 RepID=A0A561XRT2_ACIDE|nr:putative Ig domain-containing protein [Acidovorax delafieldii]TWG38823.1 putative Ig domain-containing protein [Acidovorax delafieldii]
MLKYFKFIPAALTVALAACGGGGGSSGETQEAYTITVRAEKSQLPLNVAGIRPGIGVYSPYTTTVYVDARKGSFPIPGGEDIFGCNISGGLDTGSLYYLDGKAEHETEVDDGNGGKVKVPNAYRSITLGSNSGGNSFHFHSADQAGTARIVCSVTDPRDKQQKFASVDISVGGATGKPASVRLEASIPGYLGVKNNVNGLLSQMAIQAFVLDDANQPASGVTGGSVQVRLLSGTEAAQGARLVAGSQSGSVLQLPSIGGVATFSLLSGSETGQIFLELSADRSDNNVTNGISDPMTAIIPISVLEAVTAPPVFADVDLGDVTKGVQFTSLLSVTGGLPPYSWSATGLPSGLTVDSATGMIGGKVAQDAEERVYRATITVTDKNKKSASGSVTLKVVGGLSEDFAIGGCNSNTVCVLPGATTGNKYSYSFVSSTTGVSYQFVALPTWLTGATSGTAGVLTGTPVTGDCGTSEFIVTATKGASSVTRRLSITVTQGTVACVAAP